MRILIVGINFSPELTGIGKYTGEMAEYLSKKGHKIRVITTPPYYPNWKISKPYQSWRYIREDLPGMLIYRCPLWVPRKQTGFNRLVHLFSFGLASFPVVLNQRKWRPEIIIHIAPTMFSTLSVLFLGKITLAKTWLHIQDFELDAALNLGMIKGSTWQINAANRLEKFLTIKFDRISTISHRMVERLWKKGIPDQKTIYFPNWIDTDLIQSLSRPSKFRQEWGIAEDQIVVLYSGNIGRKQGLEILVETARALVENSKILFLICGEGPMRAQLEQNASELPNVRFYPLQPLSLLNELLNLADIHVLPQLKNAADLVMPSKLTGMLASGKAIIATAFPESELGSIISEVGILSEPENVSNFSRILLTLVNNPNERIKLGQKGRIWIEANWEKNNVLSRFEMQLRNMLESSTTNTKYKD